MPAKAGIHGLLRYCDTAWIPAFAGMTIEHRLLRRFDYPTRRRRAADSRSAAITITNVTTRSSDTVWYWNRFIAVNNWKPIPPAPTKPSTRDERMFSSKRIKANAEQRWQHARHHRVAQHLHAAGTGQVSASTGPISMSSITSANSRPSMPTEWTASASAPGNGPSPTAVTNNSAHTRSGTARVNANHPARGA